MATESAPTGNNGTALRPRAVIAATACALTALYAIRIHAADTWWHLATGRWTVAHRTIPHVDPFSFVAAGEPWIYVDWLPQLVMYGLWTVGGFVGLVVLKMVLAGTAIGAAGAGARVAGARTGAVVAVMLAVAVLAQTRYSLMRPNLFGAVLLATAMAVVLRWGGRGGRILWVLPVLEVVWLPTHGSAIIGVGIAGAAVFGALVQRRPRAEVLQAFAVTALCALVFGLSVSGRHIVTLIIELEESNAIALTSEWRRTDWRQTQTWFPLGFAITGVLYAAARFRKHPFALAIAIGGIGLARGYERNLAEGVVMAAPAVALALSAASDLLRRRGLALVACLAAPAAGALIAFGHLAVEPEIGLNTRFGFGTDEARYPHDTLATLRQLPEGRTVNSFGIGGYLIWHEIPGGVFADGRSVAVWTDELFDAWILPTMRDESGLNAVADQFDIVYGLASVDSATGRVLMTAPSWIPVRYGASTMLFVRRSEAGRVVSAGYPLLNELRWDEEPGWNDGWYDAVLAAPAGREGLIRSLRESARTDPTNPVLQRVVSTLQSRAPDVVEEAFSSPTGHRR